MTGTEEYRLRIDNRWTPETLPMARLGAYLLELSRLLGEPGDVRLRAVEEGSAVLVARVDEPGAARVRARMETVRDGAAPADALKALSAIDSLLAEDDAVGTLTGPENVIYADFLGRNRPKPTAYGPIVEEGSLQGVVVKVGGTDETVPVWLDDGGRLHHCTSSREMSRRLAAHYLGETIRVHGRGKWVRTTKRTWELRDFRIAGFEVLDQSSLLDTVQQVRSVQAGATTEPREDPLSLLAQLRGEGTPH